ncbi:LysR family transcriptional regulator [Cellulomonas xiejunii]|uniref:LysR family transcriptional regulator n=1 Tax=Cellulomonas xiejunii TaxID=2968083 RepID=UPI001D0E3CF6|nr:LysR family transcriptional regulator [Cellulomonas xiejunii]MCC2316164.1 LysR family transcriptional regulator [Cellulomonas xiejunii]
MDLEVRHLRALTTIASLGSITKAAAALGIAQPALSAQLSRIDRALGGPSFVRDHRGVRPTPLGALVLDRARTLLPAMDALLQDARRLARGDATTLRLASTDSTLAAAFVHRLSEGADAPPTLRCTWDAARAVAELATGTYDAVLAGTCGDALPPAAPGVRWQLVGTDAVHVVVRADHPCGDETDLVDLADERWVVAVGEGCFVECFLRACARAGFAPPTPSECDRAAGLDLVLTGGAVALAHPYGTLPGGLRGVRLRGAPLSWSTWLAAHIDSPPDLSARIVAAARDARLDQLVGAGAGASRTALDAGHQDRPAV